MNDYEINDCRVNNLKIGSESNLALVRKTRFKHKLAIGLMALTGLASQVHADEPIKLILHHLHSPNAPTHAKLLVPWAEQIKQQSDGRIDVEVFPSMALGGKPSELYKQARDGTTDIIWTLTGYTPGVFPRTEVFELPTVHKGDAVATSLAIKDRFDLIADDYNDVKPLLVYVHAGNVIHTVDKPVGNLADLKGLKLRTPSRTGGWLIEEYGAEPVGMPLPDLPPSLSKKAIDGALVPFEIFPAFKMQDLTKHSIEGYNGDRFGTSVFVILMNKDKFDSLPADLQQLLEASFDEEMTANIGQMWMDFEKPGIELQEQSANSDVTELSETAMQDFNAAGQRVVDRWVIEMNEKGLNGQDIVDGAREAINKHSKQ